MSKQIDGHKPGRYELVPVGELIPYVNNARTHSDGQIAKLQSSIREFGFVNPVLIDGNKNIIAGHGRVEAAKREGINEVPCVFVEHLTDAQRKAYILADNRLAEMAGWDMELVQLELDELQMMDFDVDALRFDFEEEIAKFERVERRKQNDPTNIVKAEELVIEDEIWQELEGKKLFFTFSGGQDSATAVFLVAPLLKERGLDFELLFVDTGVELPGVQEYVIRFAEYYGYPLKILREGPDFFEVYEKKKAFPNAIYRDCIMALIGNVANKHMKSQCEPGQKAVNIRGGKNSQATNLSRGQKYYEKDGMFIFNPLWDLSEQAFEKYKNLLKEQFGLWEGYDKGFVRTACWCCPFQTVQQYDTIKKELPFMWGILKRKAEEWEFMGATHLDRYLRNYPEEEIDALDNDFIDL